MAFFLADLFRLAIMVLAVFSPNPLLAADSQRDSMELSTRVSALHHVCIACGQFTVITLAISFYLLHNPRCSPSLSLECTFADFVSRKNVAEKIHSCSLVPLFAQLKRLYFVPGGLSLLRLYYFISYDLLLERLVECLQDLSR